MKKEDLHTSQNITLCMKMIMLMLVITDCNKMVLSGCKKNCLHGLEEWHQVIMETFIV